MDDEQQVLSSWKEIANFLGKGVRTVQRWERELGLPVRRPQGSRQGVVLAFPHELRAWAANAENGQLNGQSSDRQGEIRQQRFARARSSAGVAERARLLTQSLERTRTESEKLLASATRFYRRLEELRSGRERRSA
jgi:phage terminase Nu1 subunit (DNA packaging protein)